ncbi:MAG: efflux RND transporter periplasmic adaptor subunit [Chlamydiia bacterium]|nr:efflux RND transporter periplasmic adaptor subunit [Chlamydiia bacterium]
MSDRSTLALLFGLCLTLSACQDTTSTPQSIRPVRVAEAVQLGDQLVQSFPGLAAATQEINLSFQVNGPLIERPAQVGTDVIQDQVLARIDPKDYVLRVKAAEGQLAQAEAALRRSKNDYDRIVRIQTEDPGATTEKAVDQARQNLDSAQAVVLSAAADLEVANNQLDYTTLRAPFGGKITATFVDNYQTVQAKQEILRLLDTSKIEMTIYVPESSMPLMTGKNSIQATFDLYPNRSIEAAIKELGTEASSVTRTYPITLIMEPPADITIFPGMAGKAVLKAPKPDGSAVGVQVPASAVASDKYGRDYVWVVDRRANEVLRRYVTLGSLQDNGLTVSEGVQAGEWVVTAGVHYLHEGQKVEVMR